MVFIIFLITILVVAYRATTPEQRKVASQAALVRAQAIKEAATRPRPDTEAFREELRARTSRALVTPAETHLPRSGQLAGQPDAAG